MAQVLQRGLAIFVRAGVPVGPHCIGGASSFSEQACRGLHCCRTRRGWQALLAILHTPLWLCSGGEETALPRTGVVWLHRHPGSRRIHAMLPVLCFHRLVLCNCSLPEQQEQAISHFARVWPAPEWRSFRNGTSLVTSA